MKKSKITIRMTLRSSNSHNRSHHHSSRIHSIPSSLSHGSFSDSFIDQPSLIAQNTVNEDPNFYFRKYASAYIQEARDLVVLRQTVSRSSAFNTVKPSQVYYSESDDAIHIRSEGAEKIVSLPSIEKIEWCEVPGPSGPVNYVSLAVKGDRNPVILYGSTESTELWFDALNALKHIECDLRQTSQAKMDVFKKAVEFLKQEGSSDIAIPPPPPNMNFSVKLSDK